MSQQPDIITMSPVHYFPVWSEEQKGKITSTDPTDDVLLTGRQKSVRLKKSGYDKLKNTPAIHREYFLRIAKKVNKIPFMRTIN